LYDTVFYTNAGDNPTADNLFHEAYTSERQNNFSQAIAKYKLVIADFRTSKYAALSIARILNCMEKARAGQGEYLLLQSYYSSLRTINYPQSIRELAEDYVIKSKVKRGQIEEAITNYQTMYQQNTNNAKGTHARLNKLCLENMLAGDNPFGNMQSQTVNHKSELLYLVTGYRNEPKIISVTQPFEFKLEQNYPNPFNPTTNVKFQISSSGLVQLKIYNLLGQEVATLINSKLEIGIHEAIFDGTNYPSGVYFYSLYLNGELRDSKKMVLIK
jgi:tetratricopeptide (TPR) repeat protein